MTAPRSFVLSPSEGETFSIGPFHIVSRVLGTQSGGIFEMHDLTLDPGSTIDYHVHRTMDETLYVVGGEVEFTVVKEKFRRPAGSVAFVPRGLHHGFTNPGPGKARVLIVFTPSTNQHEYFRALETLFRAPTPDTAAIQALQKRYDQELVTPGT